MGTRDKEDWKHLKNILLEVKAVNDELLNGIKDLHLILLNLKLEDAHIKSKGVNSGVGVIADYLNNTISNTELKVKNITKHREKSLEAIADLDKFFEIEE